MPPNRFNSARYIFNGVPDNGDTLTFGLISTPSVFEFVENAGITTPNQIEVGDLSTGEEVAERASQVINGNNDTGGNQGWSTEPDGDELLLTPPNGQPGSMKVEADSANIDVEYTSPAPNGVILSG